MVFYEDAANPGAFSSKKQQDLQICRIGAALPAGKNHRLAADRMHKLQPYGAQLLVRQSRTLRRFSTILRVRRNGVPGVGAVYPQLMGSTGDGTQFKFT